MFARKPQKNRANDACPNAYSSKPHRAIALFEGSPEIGHLVREPDGNDLPEAAVSLMFLCDVDLAGEGRFHFACCFELWAIHASIPTGDGAFAAAFLAASCAAMAASAAD